MLISKNWLSDYVDIKNVSANDIADELTTRTVEVEGFSSIGELLHNVVVGAVHKVEKHPDADKLQVCSVDIGHEKVQVVCGGSNVREGMHVALGKIGALVRWHGEGDPVELAKTKIRGVESFGMICASDEIGLGSMFPKADEKEILDLTDMDLQIGSPLANALAQDDIIIDIDNKSMTHRPDLWGHYGAAREVAALFDKKLAPYAPAKINHGKEVELDVTVKDTVLCPRYMGVVVSGIKIEPSPTWMQARLQAVGVRPINNIVDITNYVMLDLGQPMHAFDAGKLEGGMLSGDKKIQIIVRAAKAGEKIETLDGATHELSKNMLVIADKKKPIAVAGVIGGEGSEVDEQTQTILFESANFDAIAVRKTAAALGVRTESSSRFEKSLDPNNAELALCRAVELVLELVPGARVASAVADVSTFKLNQGPIEISTAYICERIGQDIADEKILEILESLGFDVRSKGGEMLVTIPSWRATKDISIAEDIVEEVARVHGYGNVETVLPVFPMDPPPQDPIRLLDRKIKEQLVFAHNFTEVKNYSFVAPGWLEKIGIETGDHLELNNPIAKDRPLLRRSLLPNMLQNIEANLHRFDTVRIFETGQTFVSELNRPFAGSNKKHVLPRQDTMLGMAFVQKDNTNPFYEISEAVRRLCDMLGTNAIFVAKPPELNFVHPGRYADIEVGGSVVGWIGELHPSAQDRLGIPHRTAVCEIRLNVLLGFVKERLNYTRLAHYPSVERDIAFVVGKDVESAEIIRNIRRVDNLIHSVELFDVYSGAGMGADGKSMAYRVVYQSPDKTLQTAEVDIIEKKVKDLLKKTFGAKMRD